MYLTCGGSSLITNQIGQRETVEELNSCAPSVLSVNEILLREEKNCPCFLYSLLS